MQIGNNDVCSYCNEGILSFIDAALKTTFMKIQLDTNAGKRSRLADSMILMTYLSTNKATTLNVRLQ